MWKVGRRQKSDTAGRGGGDPLVTVLVKPEMRPSCIWPPPRANSGWRCEAQDDRREPKPVTLTDEDLLADGYSFDRNQSVDSVFDRFRQQSPKLPECRTM